MKTTTDSNLPVHRRNVKKNGACATVASNDENTSFKKEMRPYKFRNPLLYTVIIFLFGLVTTIGIFLLYLPRDTDQMEHVDMDNIDILDIADWKIFQSLDNNGDGYLDVNEFLPLLQSCRKRSFKKMGTKPKVENPHSENFHPSDQVLTLQVNFIPIALESLTKDIKAISKLPEQSGSLKGLFLWKKPHNNWITVPTSTFRIFMPSEDDFDQLGATWWIVSPPSISQQLTSSRYTSDIEAKYLSLATLLQTFHKNVFIFTRFTPQGSLAVLRAVRGDMVDIVFRIHAEFQLNEPPEYPFWFTPSQFRGRLITKKDMSTVYHFHLEVPSDRKLNVDMEWLYGPNEMENMEVDIGYVPKMSLKSTRPSIAISEIPDTLRTDNVSNIYISENSILSEPMNLQWDRSISVDEANEVLRKKMYPFTEIKYYNFTDVFSIAKKENKLVHAVILWGSLDDQSC